ncbi:hypothetical protein [Paenibacillus sp. P22]|uniref:hypothetical protein n=1 Tax=Paenibacillus sp. P22 TaxID=483908 RepID=UPI00065FC1B2|nr:hypothetical protein [Paenibacillus sp. P22]
MSTMRTRAWEPFSSVTVQPLNGVSAPAPAFRISCSLDWISRFRWKLTDCCWETKRSSYLEL